MGSMIHDDRRLLCHSSTSPSLLCAKSRGSKDLALRAFHLTTNTPSQLGIWGIPLA